MSLSENGTVLTFNSSAYGNLTSLNDTVAFDFFPTRFDGYEIPILCIYPISGQYGPLVRILYYVLLVLSLILRSQPWIAGGCLAVALTYAGSAAIHIFALMARFKFTSYPNDDSVGKIPAGELGDIDLYALWAIVSSGCIMLTPLLLWSSTIRKLGLRPLLVYWGLLMYAAFICAMVPVTKAFDPYLVPAQATCSAVSGVSECVAGVLQNPDFDMTDERWQMCGCKDKCSLVESIAPFRPGGSTVPAITSSNADALDKPGFHGVFDFNIAAMIFVIIQGLLAIIQSQWSQQRVRNFIFRFLAVKDPYRLHTSFLRRARQKLAKWTAAGFYLLAIFSAVSCAAIFFINLVINELVLHVLPVSEPPQAIGQWAPWATFGFVVIAALIKKYHSTVWNLAMAVLRRIREGLRRSKHGSGSGSVIEQEVASRQSLGRLIKAPFLILANDFRMKTGRLKSETRDFLIWFKDPVAHSVHVEEIERHPEVGSESYSPPDTIGLRFLSKNDDDNGTRSSTLVAKTDEDLSRPLEQARKGSWMRLDG